MLPSIASPVGAEKKRQNGVINRNKTVLMRGSQNIPRKLRLLTTTEGSVSVGMGKALHSTRGMRSATGVSLGIDQVCLRCT